MVSVVISIGSNYGDRIANVSEAMKWLSKEILVESRSSDIYETPCALDEGHDYMNGVVAGFYQGTGFSLEETLKEKEHLMGRTSELRKQKLVPIDLDIVICDGEILKEWDYRQKFFKIGYEQIKV